MAAHERFRFKSLEELQAKIATLGLDLPLTDKVDVLGTPVRFGALTLPNRMAVQPMEGCDCDLQGRPGELTYRKYERFAAGGAGMLWLEACAVIPEGRANPRQLSIHRDSLDGHKMLVERIHAAAHGTMGDNHRPVLVLQLTHSGRYSKPEGVPAPLIAHHSIIDPRSNVTPDTPLLTDDYLDRLQDAYIEAALLAREAGYDAVDVKACHRYLLSELLASFTREDSRYGGSFENRARFLLEVAAKIRAAVPNIEVTSRLNIYDALQYPYGWGVDQEDETKPDFTEPRRLIEQLVALGYGGLNTTIGNPYYNPHVNRPFDFPIKGMYTPEEHPLETLHRFVHITRAVQQAFPALTVVGSGYTWVREFYPNLAAALIEQGWASVAGLGRGALACPDFARDILEHGSMSPKKSCVTCSACTQIMRDGGTAGCVVRDSAVYGPIYREGRAKSQDRARELAAKCRVCNTPTCRDQCPAGVDIPSFISKIAEGDEREAYRILRGANPLPEICAYVCPVEVQCESGCLETIFGEQPVPIKQLQRYVTGVARAKGWTKLALPPANGRRAAVVGGGPAGIACAVRLLELGHAVTVYDAAEAPGGTVGATIPDARMPADVLRAEIAAVLNLSDPARLDWRAGKGLSAEFTLDDVLAEGYDAVFLGLGLPRAQQLDSPRPAEGVLDALSFLRAVKSGALTPPARVAVIGGGNSAMDAATSALDAGATDVYLVYRRSFAELPAWPEERNHALDAGVHFLILSQPLGYHVDEAGRLIGLRVARTTLGEPDDSGRRRPLAIPGSEYLLEVDFVVEAIGQLPPADLAKMLPGVELTRGGLIAVEQCSARTSLARVHAGGDLVNGGATAVAAIADGFRAAEEIDDDILSGARTASPHEMSNI
jgi:NADPH-dependent glutamate synthase beta subunit-like oxidoreductase/2,4-dienoyl-CoA reductase-like NADH-dependent reductase (Old Yellow Enzyme family)